MHTKKTDENLPKKYIIGMMSGDSIEETYGSDAAQVSWKVTKLLFADGKAMFHPSNNNVNFL